MYIAQYMDAREVLDGALAIVDGNQAELARRLNRSETTVSRWVTGRNGIDFESALRLARLMGLPAREVVEACGLDPGLVPDSHQQSAADQQDGFVAEITAGMRAMREAGMVSELEHAKWAARFLFSVPEERVRGAGSAHVRTPRQLAARMPTTSSDGTGQSHNVPIERSNRAIHDLLSHLVTLRGVTPWAAAAV